jgi:hypothetical protein
LYVFLPHTTAPLFVWHWAFGSCNLCISFPVDYGIV